MSGIAQVPVHLTGLPKGVVAVPVPGDVDKRDEIGPVPVDTVALRSTCPLGVLPVEGTVTGRALCVGCAGITIGGLSASADAREPVLATSIVLPARFVRGTEPVTAAYGALHYAHAITASTWIARVMILARISANSCRYEEDSRE